MRNIEKNRDLYKARAQTLSFHEKKICCPVTESPGVFKIEYAGRGPGVDWEIGAGAGLFFPGHDNNGSLWFSLAWRNEGQSKIQSAPAKN